MKACMALILTSLLLVTAGSVANAKMAMEGSATSTTYFTTTYQILTQGKEYAQFNYDARGVVATENEESPLYMSSVQCIGSVKAIKGEYKEFGLCTYTRPDGDQIYGSYEGTGKSGVGAKGTMPFVGGTGKFEGFTGSAEWTRTSLKGPVKGAGASVSKFTYNWKLFTIVHPPPIDPR
jgi:hypothetical protein